MDTNTICITLPLVLHCSVFVNIYLYYFFFLNVLYYIYFSLVLIFYIYSLHILLFLYTYMKRFTDTGHVNLLINFDICLNG